jgi:hypothetical protein
MEGRVLEVESQKKRWSGKLVGKQATPAIELGSRAELRKKSKSRVANAS